MIFYVSLSGGGNDAIQFFKDGSNSDLIQFNIADGGAGVSLLTSTVAFVADTRVKVAGSYKVGASNLSADGESAVTGTPASLPTLSDKLYIGTQATPSLHLFGTIKRLVYWPSYGVDGVIERLSA